MGPRPRVSAPLNRSTLNNHRCAQSSLHLDTGGVAVLVGSTVAGRLLESAIVPGIAASHGWAFLAMLPLASALAIGPFLRRHVPDAP